MPLLQADAEDESSLREVAEGARVVATTVGPYIRHGDPLVAACAAAGTDYTDLTGEPEFVDRTYVRHHATAVDSGARLVHACGFDSIPHDLGAQFTVEHLPAGRRAHRRGVRASGRQPLRRDLPLGDHGVLAGARVREGERGAPAGGAAAGRAGACTACAASRATSPSWTPGSLPFPTIDPQIVLRSARALDRYGPDFAYGHYVAIKRLPVAVGGAAGVASLFALAQLPPARDFLLGRHALRPGPERGAAAQGLVLGALRRPRRRRAARRDGGQRRRPRLRRDGQDAGRGHAVPGARRPARPPRAR